jgi:hypothetical protein
MAPAAIAFLGAGMLLQGWSKQQEMLAQARAERENSSFYRYQAAFAQEAGDRKLEVFDHQSKILYGEQLSGFAKAGIDTAESSRFVAEQTLLRGQESYAIDRDTEMNVMLANLRANAADARANDLKKASGFAIPSAILGAGAQVADRVGRDKS